MERKAALIGGNKHPLTLPSDDLGFLYQRMKKIIIIISIIIAYSVEKRNPKGFLFVNNIRENTGILGVIQPEKPDGIFSGAVDQLLRIHAMDLGGLFGGHLDHW